jgi:flavin reductase (DIM6/NTAB) family NADH-FMN oxidoreductase RutF
LLVAVNKTASAYATLLAEERFSVNVLSDGQQWIADRFAGRDGRKGAERFEGANWTALATGAPALEEALVVFDCALEETIERHSHGLLIGRIKAVRVAERAGSLVYWNGAYAQLAARA